ncbi:hypothetical protein SBA1_190032 [Candidatus Sulfotelmatobacter kueseliae]|uniref:Uncharacterized protein n=1 Tax=Candidatus Sulfotelmatobacter kueseliae TaxID=2042962 RepID=A0A2U3KEE3_9BACT|nr:hypothetical protein SBA1_190032 [Candidatus Sulfotelmatobacter kueseliae]
MLDFQFRDPARDPAAVFLVRFAELAAQRGFFVEEDEEMECHALECGIFHEHNCAIGSLP